MKLEDLVQLILVVAILVIGTWALMGVLSAIAQPTPSPTLGLSSEYNLLDTKRFRQNGGFIEFISGELIRGPTEDPYHIQVTLNGEPWMKMERVLATKNPKVKRMWWGWIGLENVQNVTGTVVIGPYWDAQDVIRYTTATLTLEPKIPGKVQVEQVYTNE